MTAYDDFRDNAYLSELDSDIDAFIARYNSHNPAQRKTVFLFPGGMASQLKRSWFPNIAGNYASLWLDCPALVGGTTFLQLHSALEDYLRCAIVPDGNVEFFGVDPYKDFIDWCRNNGIDVFVFGWDWRRPGKASANLFLKKFIAKFTSIVAQYAPHALDNVYLIGHSFGGIVIKHMMNDFNDPFVANKVKLAITVATPFYGYAGHLPRFFKGDENLNFTQGLDGAREMTRIISTMPAGYE
ncbi:MAG: hypothetical protein N2444_07775, partial [Methylocystis sp.]|nr:hypothetical protein [Methylocystis sp.]